MSSGWILVLSLGVISIIAVVIYYLVYRKEKRDKIEINLILENLDRSIKYKDSKSTDHHGKQLLNNSQVTNKQLEELKSKLELVFSEDVTLDELRNLIYNKQLHWNRNRRYI